MPPDSTSTPTTLLPCPFCGGVALVGSHQDKGGKYTSGWRARAHCLACFVESPGLGAETEQEAEARAVAFWNKRALPESRPQGQGPRPQHQDDVGEREAAWGEWLYDYEADAEAASPDWEVKDVHNAFVAGWDEAVRMLAARGDGTPRQQLTDRQRAALTKAINRMDPGEDRDILRDMRDGPKVLSPQVMADFVWPPLPAEDVAILQRIHDAEISKRGQQ